ncbi:MAG: DUF4422 domain-containing protein [Candidatus Pelagibacterales bacterium]|nr:MAG: DUF4422 domain-containing protein [Pelagibacterales bacterium]
MINLKIYCTSIQYFDILDKLPPYIKPLGLGDGNFPKHWLNEKNGENIADLNKYFSEWTGIYWIWKNRLNNAKDADWIGNCHYRKLWLNNAFNKKQKFSSKSLYTNLLKPNNPIFLNCEAIQLQPTFLKKDTVLQQFENVHGQNILENCAKFLDNDDADKFIKYLNGNKLCVLAMFITKANIFKKYCEKVFPFMHKCLDYCLKNDLCKGKNTRLPAHIIERYTAYWFLQKTSVQYLSYARLGNFMLSNNVNKLINPIKIPFTFRMYPTLHDY